MNKIWATAVQHGAQWELSVTCHLCSWWGLVRYTDCGSLWPTSLVAMRSFGGCGTHPPLTCMSIPLVLHKLKLRVWSQSWAKFTSGGGVGLLMSWAMQRAVARCMKDNHSYWKESLMGMYTHVLSYHNLLQWRIYTSILPTRMCICTCICVLATWVLRMCFYLQYHVA